MAKHLRALATADRFIPEPPVRRTRLRSKVMWRAARSPAAEMITSTSSARPSRIGRLAKMPAVT
jgi:hypothetical protein